MTHRYNMLATPTVTVYGRNDPESSQFGAIVLIDPEMDFTVPTGGIVTTAHTFLREIVGSKEHEADQHLPANLFEDIRPFDGCVPSFDPIGNPDDTSGSLHPVVDGQWDFLTCIEGLSAPTQEWLQRIVEDAKFYDSAGGGTDFRSMVPVAQFPPGLLFSGNYWADRVKRRIKNAEPLSQPIEPIDGE